MRILSTESSSSILPALAGQKRIWMNDELEDLPEIPVKRARIHDVLRSPTPKSIPLSQDLKYHFEDGDLTLYARDTIFKVHSVILGQDGSCFESRLKYRKEEGGDRVPMQYVLPDESPRQFRQLLWSLYAPAFETTLAAQPDKVKIDKMLDISNASHKYQFGSMEKWALDAIYGFFKELPEDGIQFLSQGMPRLERVIQHAERYGHKDLQENISKRWMSLVSAGIVRPADAMDFAERCSLLNLRGYTYYHTLLLGREIWNADHSLSFERCNILLSGFERLVVRWETLKASLLALETTSPRCETCPEIKYLPLWAKVLPAGDQHQLADVLGKLQAVQDALHCLRAEDPPIRCTDCLDHAEHIINQRFTDLRDNLSDIFTNMS